MNIDSVLSKTEELNLFLKKHKIDIFFLQETKLTESDRTPKFPGYTPVRQDRFQPKGKQKNRGGGLPIGIRNTLPYKETSTQISSVEDKITEWQTIEIPTKDEEKLRITNLYVPPVRTNASRGTRTQAGDPFNASKWPAHSGDLILGDINAHSSLCDDNWDGQPDARGKIIEEWMANTSMTFLNDGSTTHTNLTTGKRTSPIWPSSIPPCWIKCCGKSEMISAQTIYQSSSATMTRCR